jgi:hypothetical protein
MTTFYCLRFETPQIWGPGPRFYIIQAAGTRYIALTRNKQQTTLPTITPLLRVTQPLPSNGYFGLHSACFKQIATVLTSCSRTVLQKLMFTQSIKPSLSVTRKFTTMQDTHEHSTRRHKLYRSGPY